MIETAVLRTFVANLMMSRLTRSVRKVFAWDGSHFFWLCFMGRARDQKRPGGKRVRGVEGLNEISLFESVLSAMHEDTNLIWLLGSPRFQKCIIYWASTTVKTGWDWMGQIHHPLTNRAPVVLINVNFTNNQHRSKPIWHWSSLIWTVPEITFCPRTFKMLFCHQDSISLPLSIHSSYDKGVLEMN